MKKQQTLFSLFLTAAMILSLLLPISAEGEKAESGNTAAAALSYIPEADAVLIAENIVQNRIGRDDCPWTEETGIDETVQLFDFDGAVSGYLFRLATAGETAGYMQVDAYAEAPQAVAFGYDCEAALDSMRKAQGKPEAASEDRIIALGVYDFMETDETGYTDMATGSKIDAPAAAELSAAYKAHKAEQKDETQKARLITLKAQNSLYATSGMVQPQAQIVYEHVNVPNLWGSTAATNFKPYTTGDFIPYGYAKHCAPTAGITLLRYWTERRGVSNLYSKSTKQDIFKDLGKEMNYVNSTGSDGGTEDWDAYIGMLSYLQKYNLNRQDACSYQDKTGKTPGFDWAWIKTQIKNGTPLYIGTAGYVKSDYHIYIGTSHAVVGLGYQECSDGCYIRIADGCDRSLSNFLAYTWDRESSMWYVRWY